MGEIELNELEAIQLTIKQGYAGEELESAKFKKLGCLDGQRDKVTGEFKNRAMIKFIRKLETIYESVTVEGKGKKRVYILKNKRDAVIEMRDDRVKNGIKDIDIVMSHFFFNRLLEMDLKESKSHHQWAIDVGAYHPSLIDDKMIAALFKDLYYGQDLDFIKNQFITYLKNRNRSFADISVKLLKRERKINTISIYMALDEYKKVYTIPERQYNNYTKRKNEILTKHNLNVFNYTYHIKSNEALRADLNELSEETGYKKVWIAYQIELLSSEAYPAITYKEFQRLFWDKTIGLIHNLKIDKTKDLSFASKFKRYNFACIIENLKLGNELSKSIIDKQKPSPVQIFSMTYERYQKGFKMPDDWEDMDALLSGNAPIEKEIEDEQEDNFDTYKHINNVTFADADIIVTDDMLPFS